MQGVQYRVLGKLDVVRDGQQLDLGAFRQRALLALFLTSPNQLLSTDQIIDRIWGEEGGADKQNALWVYISGLRKALEPDREPRSEGTILLTRSPGYVMALDVDDIDAVRFERLVERGRAVVGTDPEAASLALSEALALWRGRAYEEFTYEPFAQAEIARLEGLRLEAVELRIDADLARGMSGELVSELEAMVREHPLREGFTGQLMVALYRSGRQAEALRAFQLLRSRLGEELGIEPSGRLRRLEERILMGDGELDSAAQPPDGVQPRSGLVVRGYELRGKVGEGAFGAVYRAFQPSVGREVAVKVIRPEFANDPGFIRRFEAEAQLVARLEHPHIVPLYDFWREPNAAYLVMRFMQGGNLGDVLSRGGLTRPETAQLVDQLAGALATAHRSGVIHRDIKPANVLVDDAGNAYLSDFGIALEEGAGPSVPSGRSTLESMYASPEQLLDEPVGVASDIYSLGVLAAQALAGRVGPVGEIRDSLPSVVRPVIDRAMSPDANERHQDVVAFTAELCEVLDGGGPSWIGRDIENPFKGLRPFDAADEEDFYGRGRLVDRLVARLGEPGTRGRFIGLVGPSGSGKSSVVRAGLLPALRRGAQPGSDQWFVVEMTPAPHPFEKLEDALLAVAIDRPPGLLDVLAGSEDGLRQAVRRVLPEDGAQLLVVVDQFEELFTQVDEATARRFLDALVAAVRDGHSGVRVLITLRADFYDPPLRHRGLGELLRDGTEVITPMTPEELSSAVSGPVERVGVTVEPALAAELVSDVVNRTGALPLLQYTLTELFESRRGSWMTADAYRDLGGVSGVLARRADGLLTGLGDHAHDVTRQVFLRLVTLGEGQHDDTRRRALRSELEQLDVDGRMLQEVLDTFGRHRLLSFDRDPLTRGSTVEISHEALLTEWGRLAGWIEAARNDVHNQRRLATAMAEWVAAGRADSYLLRGGLLDQLSTWAPSSSVPLSEPEQRFLDASVAERERLATRELERERRAHDAERSAERRLRQLVGAGALVVLVGGLAIFGIVQWRSASQARDARDSLALSAEFRIASDTELTRDPELALLYAVEAVRATAELGFASEDALDSLHWALQRLGVQYPVGAGAQSTIRSGPTGLTGVFVLPPAELIALAESSTDRRLTDSECTAVTDRGCPERVSVDRDLPLRFGTDSYEVRVPEVLPGVPTFGSGRLAGTRVTLAPVSNAGNNAGLKLELDRFTEITGIEVDVLSNEGFDLTRQLVTGEVASVPDVITYFSRPPPWAEARAIDLAAFLDTETLRADFGDYLVDLFSTDSALMGVVINLQAKGLVFYPKQAFETAGYEVPATWDDLIVLSDRIVADGGTPWCFQWEAGFASGFVGSDFLESLVLRSGGVDAYDAWVSGEAAFTSPAVLEAGRIGSELLFSPGYVLGGPEAITREDWGPVMTRLLDVDPLTGTEGPQCWLVHHAAQMVDLLGPDTAFGPGGELGIDVDYFALPPFGDETLTTGGGLAGIALTDRPEIRALMSYMASPGWGTVWATYSGEGEGFFSANRRFNTASYHGEREPADVDVRLRIHQFNRQALDAGLWRWDASDLMPPAFGTWTDAYVPGPFWQGMLDWANGVGPIDEILADIEAARPR